MSGAEERELEGEEAAGERAGSEGSPAAAVSTASQSASAPDAGSEGASSSSNKEPEDFDPDALDEVDLREIMRSVLDEPPRGGPPNILRGVQKKLRARSRGKFYGDGWSTARSPRSTYLITSVFMLVLIAFVFLVLMPWGGGALPLK